MNERIPVTTKLTKGMGWVWTAPSVNNPKLYHIVGIPMPLGSILPIGKQRQTMRANNANNKKIVCLR